MTSISANPLTAAHLDQIKTGLDIIAQAKKQVELAKAAGIDVSTQEASLNDSETRLLRIKNVYFPGQ